MITDNQEYRELCKIKWEALSQLVCLDKHYLNVLRRIGVMGDT